MGESICTRPVLLAVSLASQQNAGAKDNKSPPSSGHTSGVPVAEVGRPEALVCVFNIRVLKSVAHLGTNGSTLALL